MAQFHWMFHYRQPSYVIFLRDFICRNLFCLTLIQAFGSCDDQGNQTELKVIQIDQWGPWTCFKHSGAATEIFSRVNAVALSLHSIMKNERLLFIPLGIIFKFAFRTWINSNPIINK